MTQPIKSYSEQLEIANSIHLITKLNVYLVHNNEIILSLDDTYHDVLFNQQTNVSNIVQTLDKNNYLEVKQIKNEFSLEYLVTEIPYSEAVESVLVIGPFVSDIFSQSELLTIILENNLSFDDKNRLEQTYRTLHTLTNEETFAIEFLLLNLLNNKSQLHPSSKPMSIKKISSLEDTLLAPEKDIKSIEDRYKTQYELKKIIQTANVDKANQFSDKYNHFFLLFKDRVEGNYLRSAKNTAIVGNTANRLAAEEVGVHPKYLDDISEKYAIQIEKSKTVAEIMTLTKEMLMGYTQLVQNYAYPDYSSVVKRMLNYIQFHLTEDFSLDDLAEELEMNKTYLCKKFKEETTLTIVDYLNTERIKEAETILVHSDIPLSEVAYLLGYNDYSYFSKVFKKKTGLSPGKFTTQQKNRQTI